jgi:hypothetical protein
MMLHFHNLKKKGHCLEELIQQDALLSVSRWGYCINGDLKKMIKIEIHAVAVFCLFMSSYEVVLLVRDLKMEALSEMGFKGISLN